MTTRKQIIFLEVTANDSVIKLPYKFSGKPVKATIVNWEFSPIHYDNDADGEVIAPFYFQLLFDGGLETNFIPYGACQNMVQLPLTRLGGWPTAMTIPLPLAMGKRFNSTFRLEVYGEGVHPAHFPFLEHTRLLLWIELETEDTPASQYDASTYL